MKPSLYAVLGVSNEASPQEIAAAVDQKMTAAKDNNEKVYLRHAKEVLGSPASRAAYDTKLRQERHGAVVRAQVTDGDAEPSGVMGVLTTQRGLMIAAVILVMAGIWYQQHHAKKVPTETVRQVVTPVTMVATPPVLAPMPGTVPVVAAQQSANELSPEAVYATVAPSVVVIEAADRYGRVYASGSGVVTASQQVVTNCHVVQQAVQIKVRLGGAEYAASSSTSDTYLDLCMLQVANLPGNGVARGSSANLRVGQTVYAVGAPQGLDRTLSQGLISALRAMPNGTVIQTSAAISPGSSGGGLFDSRGHLIGITTFQAKAGQNLNFAVPVDWLDTMRTR